MPEHELELVLKKPREHPVRAVADELAELPFGGNHAGQIFLFIVRGIFEHLEGLVLRRDLARLCLVVEDVLRRLLTDCTVGGQLCRLIRLDSILAHAHLLGSAVEFYFLFRWWGGGVCQGQRLRHLLLAAAKTVEPIPASSAVSAAAAGCVVRRIVHGRIHVAIDLGGFAIAEKRAVVRIKTLRLVARVS